MKDEAQSDPPSTRSAGDCQTTEYTAGTPQPVPDVPPACRHLHRLNQVLRDMVQVVMDYRDLSEVAQRVLALLQPLLPVDGLEFYTLMETGKPLHMAPENGFRGVHALPPEPCQTLLGLYHHQWQAQYGEQAPLRIRCTAAHPEEMAVPGLVLPLFAAPTGQVRSLVVLRLLAEVTPDRELAHLLSQVSLPLGLAMERESLFRALDAERQQAYERSIRDALTGLYTRHYMQEALVRLCQIHNRDPNATIAVAVFDMDRFKRVNDQHGHAMGDMVLRKVARILMDSSRSVDLPVRLGGEEFMLFVIGAPRDVAVNITERIRRRVAQLVFDAPMHECTVTISGGMASRAVQEPIERAMERADLALYQAKKAGCNRVVVGA
ncbi:MAG: GGDEF domain-containing protein [Magnetococcus sp. DMHC-8]